ncbi:MAG: hypothetical protein KGH94_00855 [Candidatus Micrarchaeota archaeon]|nr:hypothetical protein [Candidatus Micrarchaeota archaeon]
MTTRVNSRKRADSATYAASGVNTKFGNDASKVLYEAAKLTWENRRGGLGEVVELFKDFSGLRAVDVGGLPKGTFMNINFDGVGTKIEVAERIAEHRTVAFDLFAMVCDDAVVRGAEPVLVGSILDVKSLGKDGRPYINFVKQLAAGYVDAAKQANVAVVNGEVAELGARVNGFGDFNYNWGAGVVWFAKKSRMITGLKVKKGDALVGLREEGFRSNGLSLARKILRKVEGDGWHHAAYQDENVARLVLQPSIIYSAAVVEMFGGFNGEPKARINGIAHITGGGMPEKLGRMLKPSGLGANISNPFWPPDIMHHLQEIGRVRDREAYTTWNMGQGMIMATPEPDKVVKIANRHGISAKQIGEVAKSPKIVIKNYGYEDLKRELEFGLIGTVRNKLRFSV